MLLGCTIDNMVVGGPAYGCQKLEKGDVILKIDGQPVNQDNLLSYLIGNDTPGSKVAITILKGGLKVREVHKRFISSITSCLHRVSTFVPFPASLNDSRQVSGPAVTHLEKTNII